MSRKEVSSSLLLGRGYVGWREAYHVFGVSAEVVDGLRDVAVHTTDQHMVLFSADAGDEGQEGGKEEEAHLGRSGSLTTDFTSMIAVTVP